MCAGNAYRISCVDNQSKPSSRKKNAAIYISQNENLLPQNSQEAENLEFSGISRYFQTLISKSGNQKLISIASRAKIIEA